MHKNKNKIVNIKNKNKSIPVLKFLNIFINMNLFSFDKYHKVTA